MYSLFTYRAISWHRRMFQLVEVPTGAPAPFFRSFTRTSRHLGAIQVQVLAGVVLCRCRFVVSFLFFIFLVFSPDGWLVGWLLLVSHLSRLFLRLLLAWNQLRTVHLTRARVAWRGNKRAFPQRTSGSGDEHPTFSGEHHPRTTTFPTSFLPRPIHTSSSIIQYYCMAIQCAGESPKLGCFQKVFFLLNEHTAKHELCSHPSPPPNSHSVSLLSLPSAHETCPTGWWWSRQRRGH